MDERISAEEVDLLEKKLAMAGLLKERSRTEVEEWKGAVATESGVAQKVAAGFRSSEAEGDHFTPDAGGSSPEIRTKIRDPLAKSRRRRRKEEQ